jgi:hypothetical protein
VLNLRFSANTGITKTSSSTIKIFNTDLGAAGTGNILLQGGKTNIYNSQIFNVQVSGANTEVNFLQCDTVILPTVISGNVNFIDTNIVSSGSGNSLNAIGGYVTLKNCLSITPTRTLAPIGFGAGASYSYGDSGFDVANSIFAGTAVVQPGQFQAINVRGGNITVTGLVSATGNINTNGNISALGNITSNANVFTLAASGGTGAAITGAGIVAGANVATILYDNSVFGWATNVGWSPSANASLNLGRTTRYWNNFYAVNINGTNQAMTGFISATGNVTAGNISTAGTLTATGKIGYASGSTVTQTTNRGNGVTINAIAGTIVTTSASMVAAQIDTFSVANNQVDPTTDIVLVQIVSPNFGVYNCIAQPSATISSFLNGFYINIQNISGFTTSNEAITIRFMVMKAPNA